jgi:hypothetical protein
MITVQPDTFIGFVPMSQSFQPLCVVVERFELVFALAGPDGHVVEQPPADHSTRSTGIESEWPQTAHEFCQKND